MSLFWKVCENDDGATIHESTRANLVLFRVTWIVWLSLSGGACGDRAACTMGRRFLSGLLLFCAATIGTDSDDPKQMLRDFELMLRCHCVLNRFEFSREEFDDLSAFRADHVVVMLVFIVVFVVRAAVAKTNLARQAGIC